jgi:hypothetical protein
LFSRYLSIIEFSLVITSREPVAMSLSHCSGSCVLVFNLLCNQIGTPSLQLKFASPQINSICAQAPDKKT